MHKNQTGSFVNLINRLSAIERDFMTLDTPKAKKTIVDSNPFAPVTLTKSDSIPEFEEHKCYTDQKDGPHSRLNMLEDFGYTQSFNINDSFSVVRPGGDLITRHGLRKISSAEQLDGINTSDFNMLDHSLTRHDLVGT